MCYGNSGPTSSGMNYGFQNSTSTTVPDVNAYNYLLAGLAFANNVTGIPYQPYTGSLTAGFGQDQLVGMQAVREAQGATTPYIDTAAKLTQQAYNLSQPTNFSQAAVGQYFNPLMNDFVSQTPTVYSQAATQQYLDPTLQSYLSNLPSQYNQQTVSQYYDPTLQRYISATPSQYSQQAVSQYYDPTLQSYMKSMPTQYSQQAASVYQDPTIQAMMNQLPTTYSPEYASQFASPYLQNYLKSAPLEFNQANLQQYYSPYQQNVIDTTLAQINQQNQQQMAQQQAEAIRAGAFGGDRSSTARANLAGQQALAKNQVIANLQNQGYQNALNTFAQQQTQGLGVAGQLQNLGVSQFNAQQALKSALAQQQAQQQTGLFTNQQALGANIAQQQAQQALAQFNQQQALGANVAQQQAQQAMNQFNTQQALGANIAQQQAQQRLSQFNQQQAAGLNARQQAYANAVAQYNQQQQQAIAAAQAAAYSTAQLGSQEQQAALQGAQALLGTGALQQQLQQQQINQNYNQWLANQAYPYQQLKAYLDAAGLTSGLGGTTNTSSSGVSFGNTQQSGSGSSAGQVIGSILGGLGAFGLSDERTKTNVDYVGKDPSTGDNLYAYDYKSDVERSKETGAPMPPKRISPMAQEVAEKNPEDVVDLGGLLGVKLDREGKANGGVPQVPSMPPIYLDTGEMAPPSGFADLSSVAYPTDPNLNIYKPSGLNALFTPEETFEKIKSKWVSKDQKPGFEDVLELSPFKAEYSEDESDKPRHEKAEGGSSTEDPSDFIAMSKYRPYGVSYNPKIATALAKPVPELNPSFPKTHELNYVPGLPGGKLDVKAPAMSDDGSKIGSNLGKLAKSGYSALTKKDESKPEGEQSMLDKIKTNMSEGLGGIFNSDAAAPVSPAPVAPDAGGGFDVLGGIGKMFGGLFKDGGRVALADGGTPPADPQITGSQIGPITNPYGTGTINGVPAGVGAFNYPVNNGITVQQAFGPKGLGRDIPASLANYKLPWTAVNTGSTTYNNLLLKAAQNVGPRQLTPQEFGLPAINQDTTNLKNISNIMAEIKNAPTKAQIDAEQDPVAKQKLQNQADNAALKAKYPMLFFRPTNYNYQLTDWLTPEGTYFMVPTSSYNTADYYVNPFATTPPTFKADGGSVRDGYKSGGRSGIWGRLQDAEEGARAAALAIKEDVMHPQEVLHSIWNRVKAGTYGETPSEVMAARRQYEPMNPANRGTSRDPRMVNPNDPKVRELADYWSKIKAGEVEDPTKGATHFMNPDIVSQRRHGHFKPWERTGLQDPASVRVGKQIYYNPNRNAVAADRAKGDYFSNIKPAQPYGPGDPSVLAGGYGKYGEPIPNVMRSPFEDNFGKGLDLSGGPMSMKNMGEQYPVEPMTGASFAGRNIGAGDMDLTIGQAAGLPALADPGTPGTTSPPLNVSGTDVQTPMGNAKPMGFGDVPPTFPEPTSETNKITEVKDGRHPVVKTTAVSQPAPGHKVIAEKSAGFGPVKGVSAKDTAESDNPFEGLLNDLFGGKDAGYLQGPDIGDLGDLLGFSHGGAVRHGYEGGGRAKEAWDILTGEYGATPAEASVLVPAAAAESAFDPTAVHDQGTGYGLFGHRLERADALRKALADKASDFKEQLGFGLKEFRGRPEHRYVEGENPSLEDIMQAHGAFERPAGYKPGQPEGMLGYGKRRALTEAALKGDFGSFGNYKGSAGGGDGSHIVATDRGDEGDGDTLGGLRKMLGGDKEEGTGLFGMKPIMNRDLAMYLMATGAGMAASRSRSPLQALGEGSLQGIEAMQASAAGREASELKKLQSANVLSEIQKRNFELNELMRKARARRELLGAPPSAGAAVSSDEAPPSAGAPTGAPTGAPAPLPVPKIVDGGTEAEPTAAPVSETIPVAAAKPTEKKVVEPVDQYDAEIVRIEDEIAKNRNQAKRAVELGIPEEAKQYEDRADKAQERREKVVAAKQKFLTEKVGEGSPADIYSQGQASAAAAQDMKGTLNELEGIIQNPKVDFGIAAPYLMAVKSGTAEAEQYFPGLKSILPTIDTEALGQAERLGSEGNKLVLAATNGKLGAGVSNADISFLKDTVFNVSRTRDFNMNVLRKQQALQDKLIDQAAEQERYRREHGGLDANFQSHMSKWGQAHPVQSYMRKEAEHKAGQIGAPEKTVSKDRTIKRRGTSGGRPVVEYSDGTVEYAD